MADLYGTAPSSATGVASSSDPEEISSILNHLLHNSSSSLFPSVSSSSCMSPKAKYMHLPHSSPQSMGSCSEIVSGSTLFGSEEDRLRFRGSAKQSDGNSVGGSSGFNFSEPGDSYFEAEEEVKGGVDVTLSPAGFVDSDADTYLGGRRISPENDLGDFSCDSEGPEASEVPSKPVSSRSSSKRSRAAEVHNLSEKRRRSRINEKMKALQNLIPNSNKTDKASMLDEAIEYLKQLQLQVQMLSMRNGLNLHPMCLAGVVHPMQLPLPHTGLGYNDGNKFLNSSRGLNTFFTSEERSMQSVYNFSNSCNISNQPTITPSVPDITSSEAALGFEQSIQAQFRPFNLPTAAAKEILADGKSHLQLDTSHTGNSCSSNVGNLSSKSPEV